MFLKSAKAQNKKASKTENCIPCTSIMMELYPSSITGI